MFEIHSSIPVPSKTREELYPFEKMAVGDCFFFDSELAQRVAGSASRYGRINGKRFSIRKSGDQHGCWRLEDGPRRPRNPSKPRKKAVDSGE